MQNSVLLGMYGLAFFCAACMLPRSLWVLRCMFGYTSMAVLGGTIISMVFPAVSAVMLVYLNGGALLIWNLLE